MDGRECAIDAKRPGPLTVSSVEDRTFLFLQGPPGCFFRQLGQGIAAGGARVLRINLNGGDEHDWAGPATCYRGRARNWPLFIDHFLRDESVTDLVLFGDCRPLHMPAHQMARLRGIRVHVFEEGYIRPNWLTLERDGVNGHSRLTRDPAALLAAARTLPAPADLPPIGATLGRRVRDTTTYFRHVAWGRAILRYPFYRSHRPGLIALEGLGWAAKWLARQRVAHESEAMLAAIAGRRYFLFPLQLSSDYQIRTHSAFASVGQALDYVLASFAADAPADVALVVKEHPLDARFGGWRGTVLRRARHHGLENRVIPIAGGDLETMAAASLGVVVVNSTSATFALASGVPVMALGKAIYDIPGITHQGQPASFWTAPQQPRAELYDAFCRVLHRRCLVRGGLASASAIRILVENSVERLLAAQE
jgi:capsular polysaccharide export protein